MGKVSIGLRGWRFDEEEVFDRHGNLRPMEEMAPDTQQRLTRLVAIQGGPCDACWLIHGDENVEQCNVAEVVYGEPLAEITLCADHEADFYYWFETEGEAFAGTDEFQDRFHEWFAAGNRAPEAYGGVEHVETDPDDVPEPQVLDQSELNIELPEEEQVRIDFRNMRIEEGREVIEYHEDGTVTRRPRTEADADDGGERTEGDADDEPLDLDGVDLGTEYPGG